MNRNSLSGRFQICRHEVAAATEGPAVCATRVELHSGAKARFCRGPTWHGRSRAPSKHMPSPGLEPSSTLPSTPPKTRAPSWAIISSRPVGLELRRCDHFANPEHVAVRAMLFGTFAFAQNITGTVTNGTTGKPAAGDDVTLLSLSQGMEEVGSTKSDGQGKFSFPRPRRPGAAHGARHARRRELLPARWADDARRNDRRQSRFMTRRKKLSRSIRRSRSIAIRATASSCR